MEIKREGKGERRQGGGREGVERGDKARRGQKGREVGKWGRGEERGDGGRRGAGREEGRAGRAEEGREAEGSPHRRDTPGPGQV